MKGVITTEEFRAIDYEEADVLLGALLYSDIHASFKEFVRLHVPQIEAQIAGKIVLIVPSTGAAPTTGGKLTAANSSPEYADRLGIAEKEFPCLAFFAGVAGVHATAFAFEYRKDPDDYIDDFYQILVLAKEVRLERGLEGERDPNVIVHRRGEVVDELRRRNRLRGAATRSRNIVASSTIANVISFARLFGWFITRT